MRQRGHMRINSMYEPYINPMHIYLYTCEARYICRQRRPISAGCGSFFCRERTDTSQGYLAHNKLPPTVGLCLGPCGGPRGWVFSYERGTPELERRPPAAALTTVHCRERQPPITINGCRERQSPININGCRERQPPINVNGWSNAVFVQSPLLFSS